MRLVENAIVAGRFRLNHLLQRGGMGSVWHATHLGLDIPCALKFVKGELLENEDVVARFEREAKAAAQLRSPNVVQILDHGVFEGTPYMAMELLDGEDLGVRLRRLGRLPPESLYYLMTGVCRALSKAHSLGIVHRDLKPGNIFLVKDDDMEITKVLDFGIAKTLTSDIVGGGTKTGAMLGTPYYMSPEQAQGTRAVDFRSDLWSLAVICYQCLTGKLPFESEALGDLLVKIIVAPIPVPSQVASVPPGFDKWWAKAASRDAADRFQTAKEFSDTLAIVCGISHVSSVIDRSQIHIESVDDPPTGVPGEAPGRPVSGSTRIAAPRTVPGAAPPRAPSPPAAATAPGSKAAPPAPGAPAPAMLAPPSSATVASPLLAPAPVGGAAPQGAAALAGAPAPGQATPQPLSRSVGAEDATMPIQRKGSVVGYVAAGLVFVAVMLGIGWFAFRDRGTRAATAAASSAAQASAATPPATASAAPSAAPTASTADTAAAPATATASATAAPTWPPPWEGTAQPTAANTPDPAAKDKDAKDTRDTKDKDRSSASGSTAGSSTGSRPRSSKPTPPKTPGPSKGPVDMGF